MDVKGRGFLAEEIDEGESSDLTHLSLTLVTKNTYITTTRFSQSDQTTYLTPTSLPINMNSTQNLPFRFFALPQELRDCIYRDVLTATYLVELPLANPASNRLTILQVSRSIHHEAKQILSGLGTFRFSFHSTGLA